MFSVHDRKRLRPQSPASASLKASQPQCEKKETHLGWRNHPNPLCLPNNGLCQGFLLILCDEAGVFFFCGGLWRRVRWWCIEVFVGVGGFGGGAEILNET